MFPRGSIRSCTVGTFTTCPSEASRPPTAQDSPRTRAPECPQAVAQVQDTLQELRQQLREAQAARAAAEHQLAQHTAAIASQDARRKEREEHEHKAAEEHMERDSELSQHRAAQEREAAEEQARADLRLREVEEAREAEALQQQLRRASEQQEGLRADLQAKEAAEKRRAAEQEDHQRAEQEAREAAEQERRAAEHAEREQAAARQRAEQDGAATSGTVASSCRGLWRTLAVQGFLLKVPRCPLGHVLAASRGSAARAGGRVARSLQVCSGAEFVCRNGWTSPPASVSSRVVQVNRREFGSR
jgi:hypothetical protein